MLSSPHTKNHFTFKSFCFLNISLMSTGSLKIDAALVWFLGEYLC